MCLLYLYNCTERQRQLKLKTHHKSREARGEHDRSAGLVEMISAVDLRNEIDCEAEGNDLGIGMEQVEVPLETMFEYPIMCK